MSRQVGDIAAALAYQVKKEIAENYFGTRKILEEERDDLLRQRKPIETAWQQEVLPILTRIFQLFIREEEGRAFLNLIQREDLIEWIKLDKRSQGTDPSLFCPLPFALTFKGRYKKLIFTLYQTAKAKEDELWQEFIVVQKKVSLFNEDVEKFNSCYNLSEILSLINSFENKSDLKGVLGENTDPRAIPMLEEKMLLRPLDLSEEKGNGFFRPLPSLKEIQKPLRLLINLSFHAHGPEIQKMMRPQ